MYWCSVKCSGHAIKVKYNEIVYLFRNAINQKQVETILIVYIFSMDSPEAHQALGRKLSL